MSLVCYIGCICKHNKAINITVTPRPRYSSNSTCCVTSRHHTTSTMFQHYGRRRSSSARVYKFSLLCSGFVHQSLERLLQKVRWTCPLQSTQWRRPRSTCRCESRLSGRACRTVQTDNQDTARHDIFLCQNAWAR